VDLNRNCATDKLLYESVNTGYSDLKEMLNPTKKAHVKSLNNIPFKNRFLEGYYPSSTAWRSKAILDAKKVLLQALRKYQEMDDS
jgi:hypothetical protein